MLSKMSLGIVGLGRLGKIVANYARCLAMKVYYFDPYVCESDIKSITRINSLEELVAISDIVTIHVPLKKETTKLFNEHIFPHFKNGSYLINTSRSDIVDQGLMLAYLRNGHLAGAAIDVFEGEFDRDFPNRLKDHPLIVYAQEHQNLLVTPHIGGSTIDAWRLTEQHVIKSVIEKLKHSDVLSTG